MKVIFLSLFLSVVLCSSYSSLGVSGSSEHLVLGRVVDANGAEVPRASVEAIPRATNEQAGEIGTVSSALSPWVPTDVHGVFSLRLPAGEYKLVAKNEADGYPDPIFLLNRDPTARFPIVIVGETDISGVQITLGARGGIIEGELRDQRSELPVPTGKITIRDAQNADAYVETFADKSGRFRFAIPNKPVVISATASGYRVSFVAGGGQLSLSGGEERHVIIELVHN